MRTLTKILIANRGEIAVRIIQTAKKLGIKTLAVYTADERESTHVQLADQAILLGGKSLEESYLNQQLLINLALSHAADAIHPGIGFLAENAQFAEKVNKAGIIFIGPTTEQISQMGEKNKAFEIVSKLDIPVLPSVRGNAEFLQKNYTKIGFPLMIKASAGGGGKGIFIAHSAKELSELLKKAERQAVNYFSNGDLFMEKYLQNARHVEVQILGDSHGNIIHLYERECSLQRRYQKIIEEAPASFLTDDLRKKLLDAALKIAASISNQGLGTVEFLVDGDQFYFLEMNTRIQVEHPVTEAITGIDLVEQQLQVAAGYKLRYKQNQINIKGHAIEARVCAENALQDFKPSAGIIDCIKFSEQLRTDSFLRKGTRITTNYDSLLAKQIAYAENRDQAIAQLKSGLEETFISGVQTNLSYLRQILHETNYLENKFNTAFLEENAKKILSKTNQHYKHESAIAFLIDHFFSKKEKAENAWQQIGFWRHLMSFQLKVDGEELQCTISNKGNVDRKPAFGINIQDKKYTVGIVKQSNKKLQIQVNGELFSFYIVDRKSYSEVFTKACNHKVKSNLLAAHIDLQKPDQIEQKAFQNTVTADLYGKILSVEVEAGELIEHGKSLLTIESMKTEFKILVPQKSRVKKIHVGVGAMVKDQQLLIELEPIEETKK